MRGVSKTYDVSNAGLRNATFAVRRGEFVFMVGQTGSGKSTLMRLLIKELEPDEGRILVAGRDLAELTHKQVPYYRRNLGVVFQDFKLLPNRTVHDNVAYALQVTGSRARRSARRCRTSCASPACRRSCTTTPTSSPAASSSASRSRARSSTTRRCCWPTSRPATSIPRRRSGSCSCSTASTAPGTTVLVATHDNTMVDRMRRRVLELDAGRIVRDEIGGRYAPADVSTAEFGALLREPAPEPRRAGHDDPGDDFDDAFRD